AFASTIDGDDWKVFASCWIFEMFFVASACLKLFIAPARPARALPSFALSTAASLGGLRPLISFATDWSLLWAALTLVSTAPRSFPDPEIALKEAWRSVPMPLSLASYWLFDSRSELPPPHP